MEETQEQASRRAPLEGILTFEPQYKHVVWGGSRIATFKGVAPLGFDVGESWEVSPLPGHMSRVATPPQMAGRTLGELAADYGEELLGGRVVQKYGREFPLLVKIIDAREDLSVQVHPDDALALERHGCRGKAEMWYCLSCADGAYLYDGFRETLDEEGYRRRVALKTILPALKKHYTHPGEVYYLPSGRVHAIGGGNLLLEIQQASDVTYRIYDYGRGRELHVEQSARAIFPPGATAVGPLAEARARRLPLRTPYFNISEVRVDPGTGREVPLAGGGESFTLLFAARGKARLTDALGRTTALCRGHTALVPASVRALRAEGSATLVAASL